MRKDMIEISIDDPKINEILKIAEESPHLLYQPQEYQQKFHCSSAKGRGLIGPNQIGAVGNIMYKQHSLGILFNNLGGAFIYTHSFRRN